MHRPVAVPAALALALALTAGCSPTPTRSVTGPDGSPVAQGPPWHDEFGPAPDAGRVGGPGEGCELPVTFSRPEKTTAKPVEVPEGELGEELYEALAKRGGATAVCEVDGRRAGKGFLYVWTVDRPDTEARPALDAFLAAGPEQARAPRHRTVRAGAFEGVEATWTTISEATGEEEREWALAFRAGKQLLLVSVSLGLITEAEDVLPGYRLVTGTLAAAS
jgi:hypothetical protein